jgi:1,2-diacylglycerol 3-alpha-glucosyltransferase
MRILIAGETYYSGLNGQATFMVNLAEGLARHQHEVVVVIPSPQSNPFREESNGVRVEGLRSIPLNTARPDIYYTPVPGKAVRRIFKEFQPEIVHIHDHYPISWAAYRAARRSGIRVIGTNHFMPDNLIPYFPHINRMKPVYERLLWNWMLNLYNRLDVVTAASRTAVSILSEAGLWVPVIPISCGIDLNRFRPDLSTERQIMRQRYNLDPEGVVLLFVGRVDGEKRLDLLLYALNKLNRQDIQLVIAGNGGERKRLEALAATLGLNRQVLFTGYVPDADLPGLLNSVDIFVMPSEAELLSIATLEAMASARPILAARARALPELVADGINGYLFKPGDFQDAARAIALLVDHPDRWPSFGAASLERSRPHDLDNTLATYQNLYKLALSMPALQPARTRLKSLLGKRAPNSPPPPTT